MSNIYYYPEDFGLTVVGEIDDAGSYEFNTIVVWSDGDKLYWAHDSGCSCPTPFEDYDSNSGEIKVEELRKSVFNTFEDEVMHMELPLGERRHFIDKVKKLLKY